MSRRLTAAIAAVGLGAGLLLGAVGGVLAGGGSVPGMMGSQGAFPCDASHMGAHMTTAQMSQMMGGSFGGMMGQGMGAGMMGAGMMGSGMMGSGMMGAGMMGSGMMGSGGAGLHQQHHGSRP